MPKVIIVILNYNGANDLPLCLYSLRQIDYPNYKVIVVDNHSEDDSVSLIRKKFKEVKLIENKENLGFALGNNIGIKQALKDGADYVLILNPDTKVSRSFLKKLVVLAEKEPQAGILGPRICYLQRAKIIWFAGGKINWWRGRGEHLGFEQKNQKEEGPKECDFITGCAMLIKKEVFNKIGFFAPDYFLYYEDLDFCQRAKEAGFKILYCPSALIWHKEPSKKTELFRTYYLVRNGLLFMKKYAPLPFLVLFYLECFIKAIKHIISAFLGNPTSKVVIAAYRSFLKGERGKNEDWH